MADQVKDNPNGNDAEWKELCCRFIARDLDDKQVESFAALLNENKDYLAMLRDQQYCECLLDDLGKGCGNVPNDLDLFVDIQQDYQGFTRSASLPVATFDAEASHRTHARSRHLVWGLATSTLLVSSLILLAVYLIWSSIRSINHWETATEATFALAPAQTEENPSPIKEQLSSGIAVAKLLSDVVWDTHGSHHSLKEGDVLEPGWMCFRSGLIAIEFYNGASLIVRGPAELELISINNVYCAQGSITADVPQQAIGFQIKGPQTDIVDLGTSFQLNTSDMSTFVNVLDGEIELHKLPGGVISLKKGKTVLIRNDGSVSPIDLSNLDNHDQPSLVSHETLEELKSMEQLRLLQRLEKQKDALCRDPSLLVFFDFEKNDVVKNRKVLNASQTGKERIPNGVVVNSEFTRGRLAGLQAIEFKRLSDRFRFDIPGEYDTLSMAVWIRVDSIERMYNSIFTTDGFLPGELHWHLLWGGDVELGVFFDENEPCQQIRSACIITPQKIGEWMHLAFTVDSVAGEAVLYMNGEVIRRNKITMNIPFAFRTVQLGNWTPTGEKPVHPIRHFSGAIDEFLIFDHALSEMNVKNLYEGRPLQSHQ